MYTVVIYDILTCGNISYWLKVMDVIMAGDNECCIGLCVWKSILGIKYHIDRL